MTIARMPTTAATGCRLTTAMVSTKISGLPFTQTPESPISSILGTTT